MSGATENPNENIVESNNAQNDTNHPATAEQQTSIMTNSTEGDWF